MLSGLENYPNHFMMRRGHLCKFLYKQAHKNIGNLVQGCDIGLNLISPLVSQRAIALVPSRVLYLLNSCASYSSPNSMLCLCSEVLHGTHVKYVLNGTHVKYTEGCESRFKQCWFNTLGVHQS